MFECVLPQAASAHRNSLLVPFRLHCCKPNKCVVETIHVNQDIQMMNDDNSEIFDI